MLAAIVIAILTLGGMAAALWIASPRPTALETAVASCDLESSEYVEVGDDGHTLTIDGESDAGDDGLPVADTACLLIALDTSTAALAQMDGTNSLQGRQTATWDAHPRQLDLSPR